MSQDTTIFFPRGKFTKLERDLFKKLTEFVLVNMKIAHCELSIKFIKSHDIKELNHKYRGINKETDVITFTSGESNPETGNLYLGDIAIAYDVAASNAEAINKTVREEISLLIVHGILHLLNYSDDTDNGYTEMVRLQNDLLQDFQVMYGQIH